VGVNTAIPDHLTDGHITIRKIRPDDAERLHRAIQESGPELPHWMPDLSPNLTPEMIRGWIGSALKLWDEGSDYNFVVLDAADGSLLGGCGLSRVNPRHRFANLFYWVKSEAAGKGVATAATKLVARFGFEHASLHRVEIVVAVGNEASERVAEKAGATREGLARNRLIMDGKPHDAHMFSLIPTDRL
jgi:ribosomal-protein-serine acetyltransferase